MARVVSTAGVVEITTDAGANWIRLESELLTDPYDGPVSGAFQNPLAGDNAWCGDPQEWLNSVVDIDAFAGETVQIRFRLATDISVEHALAGGLTISKSSLVPEASSSEMASNPATPRPGPRRSKTEAPELSALHWGHLRVAPGLSWLSVV